MLLLFFAGVKNVGSGNCLQAVRVSLAARAGEGFVIVGLLFSIFYLVVKEHVARLTAPEPGSHCRCE